MKHLKLYEYWNSNISTGDKFNYNKEEIELSQIVKDTVEFVNEFFLAYISDVKSTKIKFHKRDYRVNIPDYPDKVMSITITNTLDQSYRKYSLIYEIEGYGENSVPITKVDYEYLTNFFNKTKSRYIQQKSEKPQKRISDIIDPVKRASIKYNL